MKTAEQPTNESVMTASLVFTSLSDPEKNAINTLLKDYQGDKLAAEQKIYAESYKTGEGDIHDIIVAQMEHNARQGKLSR